MIATIGVDVAGQAYNINADTVAGAIAVALGAEKLVFLTDIEGLRRDVDDAASLISRITAAEIRLLDRGRDDRLGMIPKVESCLHAVATWPRAHLRRPHRSRAAPRTVHRQRHRHDDRLSRTPPPLRPPLRPPPGKAPHERPPFDTTGIEHCPFMPVFGAPAISFERGHGTELWDTDGKRYLDFLSGIAVVSLGHANPVMADAIAARPERSLHVCNFFANPERDRAAVTVNELLTTPPGGRDSCSSPTPVPRPTNAPSNWPANSVGADATPS